jgi:hypothetical protein
LQVLNDFPLVTVDAVVPYPGAQRAGVEGAVPSNMAVLLNMTDYFDGFTFTSHAFLSFPLYNQALALSVSASLPRHVSCYLTSCRVQALSSFLCKISLLLFKRDELWKRSKDEF